jgi:hypothetical protein
MPNKVAWMVGIGVGLAIFLATKYLGEIVGGLTVVGVWLLLGLITFFTLPLEFFPQKSVEATTSDEPLPSTGKRRKALPWLVRLTMTILFVPLILGGLSIRRSKKALVMNKPNQSTEPTATSDTAPAEHPPRQP